MLSDELRRKLIEAIKKEPKDAVKEIEKDPKILELLLNTAREAEVEKTRYVNMTSAMQQQLQQKSKELQITQGLLIGAGLLLLLSLLDSK